MRATLAAACVAAALAAAPAHAVTFGANLDLPANSPVDCTVIPLPTAFGTGYYTAPSFQQTCTWMDIGTVNNPAAGTGLVPVGGTVTQIRVRVGPITGPMQVVVMRAFRNRFEVSDPVCCIESGRTPVFTPAPNAVTTIDTALPVRKDVLPDPITNTLTFDSLALSVLAPNVPVPAFDTNIHDPSNFNAPLGIAFHPAVAPGQEAFAGSSGVGGFQLLLQANVEPVAAAVPGGTAPAATAPAAIRVVQPAVTVRNGVAPLLVRCSQTNLACQVVVQLQNAAGAARAAKVQTFGEGHLTLAAGKQGRVRVKLNRAGKRLLKRKRSVKMWANATVSGQKQPGVRVTLKRGR